MSRDTLMLHVPAFEELSYRQRIMADPETMSYNMGYDLPWLGYDRNTGCISFPPDKWQEWYDAWIGCEPKRYYAYIRRATDGAFIGEVNLHKSDVMSGIYEMGIVIEACYRGEGYAKRALRLLMRQAFEHMGARCIHNDFESVRVAALRVHLSAGFRVEKTENGIVHVLLSREDYEISKGKALF